MSGIRGAAQQLQGAQAVAQDGERQQQARQLREQQSEEQAMRNAEANANVKARSDAAEQRRVETLEAAAQDLNAGAERRAEARIERDGSAASSRFSGGAGKLNATPDAARAERFKPVPGGEETTGEANTSPEVQQQEGRGEIIDTLA